VKAKAMKVKLGWIAILAVALLMTSLQAKLGLYRPEHSEARLISKAFKLSECRLDRAVPDSPAVTVSAVTDEVAGEDLKPEPDFLEYVVPPPPFHFPSQSFWIRPPPIRS
jgi:hypothetical protein